MFNYLKINNILIDNNLFLLKTDVLRQIIKSYKMKKQKESNKKYKLNHPEKFLEIARKQAYKMYHQNEEYRLSKIEYEKGRYRLRKRGQL